MSPDRTFRACWPSIALPLVGGLSGFSVYLAMYAFRRPFAAASYAHIAGWPFVVDYKTVLVIAQAVGYALSKMLGVAFIAQTGSPDVTRWRRGYWIIGLVMSAWLALLLFAIVPAPWNVGALFLNGLPLGLIWGLVFSYLEGRRFSDVMAAMLCASFIVASGVVKSVGSWLMQLGVAELWMPAATGLLFLPLLLVAVVGLESLPPHDERDQALRIRRTAMDSSQRIAFVRQNGVLLFLLIAIYVLFSALRDIRDNFSAEIWAALGEGANASIFTTSELPAGVLALAALATIMMIRTNRRAIGAIVGVVLLGAASVGIATVVFKVGLIGPLSWMIVTGTGLYMVYTPFSAILFDRLIALRGQPGNAGFLIYLADALGYIGSVGILVYRSLVVPKVDIVTRYIDLLEICSAIGVAITILILVLLNSSRWFLPGFCGHARPASSPPQGM